LHALHRFPTLTREGLGLAPLFGIVGVDSSATLRCPIAR
jgi:hypothetical protein